MGRRPVVPELTTRLRNWLIAQRFASGVRLPAAHVLCQLLGCRRSSLNVALTELERTGVVRSRSARVRVFEKVSGSAPSAGVVLLITLPSLDPRLEHSDRDAPIRQLSDGIYQALTATYPDSWQVIHLEDRQRPLPRRVRGIIIHPDALEHRQTRSLMDEAITRGIPIVSSTTNLPHGASLNLKILSVDVDHSSGCRQLLSWLASQGRRRVIRVRSRWDNPATEPAWRIIQTNSVAAGCEEYGLKLLETVTVPKLISSDKPGDLPLVDQARLHLGFLAHLLMRGTPPDAILCDTDGMVPATALACRMVGLDPNVRPMIVGYDGYGWWAPWMRVRESEARYRAPVSVDIGLNSLGAALVMALKRRLENPQAVFSSVLNPVHVIDADGQRR